MPGEADRARGTLASHSSPGGCEERSRLAREARHVTVSYREAGASGGWSVPKGRVGLPLRRTDGGSLLVPTRDPDSLRQALLARLSS